MTAFLDRKRVLTDGARFKKVVDLDRSEVVGLPNGQIDTNELRSLTPGMSFVVNDKRYFLMACDVVDYILEGMDRDTQIVYPKDAAYLLLRLDVTAGKQVGEAGTGSGAMTILLSRAVGRSGYLIIAHRIEPVAALTLS